MCMAVIQGSAQEYLSGGHECVLYKSIFQVRWIGEKCKNSTGRILEGTGQLSHCHGGTLVLALAIKF